MDEPLRPLLERTLAIIRRAGPTPLLSSLDSEGILRAAGVAQDVSAAFDRLVRGTLGLAPRDVSRISSAEWLDGFHAAARSVDPQAVEIVGLRLEGFSDREIAARLGLGLRLVRRIAADLGEALRPC